MKLRFKKKEVRKTRNLKNFNSNLTWREFGSLLIRILYKLGPIWYHKTRLLALQFHWDILGKWHYHSQLQYVEELIETSLLSWSAVNSLSSPFSSFRVFSLYEVVPSTSNLLNSCRRTLVPGGDLISQLQFSPRSYLPFICSGYFITPPAGPSTTPPHLPPLVAEGNDLLKGNSFLINGCPPLTFRLK